MSDVSPNIAQHAVNMRATLSQIETLMLEYKYEDQQPNWEAIAQIQQFLLRAWIQDTSAEFSTNERHKLLKLTNEILNHGMESEVD